MAKKATTEKRKHEGKVRKISKSAYGSHKSFLIKELENGLCVCNDGTHEYVTRLDRLDNGLADPARWSQYEQDNNISQQSE